MQNKGFIKLFALLFGLVSVYQLTFTFVANYQERKAEKFAAQKVPTSVEDYSHKREKIVARYLDSITNEPVYNLGITSYTYKEVKDRELKEGLDLKGGINVTLQVSVHDILRGLADNSKNANFEKALAQADKRLRETDQSYIDLFFEAFEATGAKLSAADIFGNKILSAQITPQMSNSQVQPIIRRKVDESISSAFEVLRKRIDKFGVTNPDIKKLGNSGRISVELPGAKDISRVKNLLQSTAQLEFWETFKAADFSSFFSQLNAALQAKETPQTAKSKTEEATSSQATDTLSTLAKSDTLAHNEVDSLLNKTAQKKDSITPAEKNPLFDLFQLTQGESSPSIGYFLASDTTKLLSYLHSDDAKRLQPAELKNAKFVFGKPHKLTDLQQLYRMFMSFEYEQAYPAEAKNFKDRLQGLLRKSDLVELYALRGNRNNEPPLNGSVVTEATQTYDNHNQPCVSMNMDIKGAKIWENLTGKVFTEKGNIAIVLDNIVYSAPSVTTGPISGGSTQITGNFTVAEAQDLANVLRAGKLPASADIVQSVIVGPSLGQEAITSGFISFAIAGLIIFFWMLLYYGRVGVFADIALLFNILLMFGILVSINSVLTLPGIAGIVLTIGMSIDANVIIFERIREELRTGKILSQAVHDGFSHAITSVLDANITTFLTGAVLFVFGSGPIKGFATTLMIGIITTIFTAVFITRLLIDNYVAKGKDLSFSTSFSKNILTNVEIDFLSKRKIWYIVSSILILISLGSMFTRGFDQGIDFVGGRSYQIRFKNPVKTEEISRILKAGKLGSVEVKTFGSANQVRISTKYKYNDESTQTDNEIQQILYEDLKPVMGADISYDEFMSGEGLGVMKSDKTGPSIAEDIKSSAVWAIIGSLVIIFGYILVRFRKWQFSMGAVAALTHDVTITLGAFSLLYSVMPFSLEIDQQFIAAILTVIGYSLNDTVIIFDRIREEVGKGGWKASVLNHAISTTLSRTLNTSLTTLLTLLAIFIFGGETLRGFMFAMIIGVVVGTYSSIFVATPLVYDSSKKDKDKK
ncbi:protein translocase subunit SecDF [Capnocytophaga sp. oral taxon 338]|uniref:protein translocase subunit SecDF n=1 Tax=Capnocytophaga sp. oral taxon 338 TaxID=710239 RepID=UPI000202F178|nr:protein translocase subunit SecDF [Capnocytophaga sp. oral taxon 338]EGD33186.1 protein-export membrane protein SecD/SecF [Capnocytophaga sp. oral taxon 338 str. F0234]